MRSTAHQLLTAPMPTRNRPTASRHQDRARAPVPTCATHRFSWPRLAPTGSCHPHALAALILIRHGLSLNPTPTSPPRALLALISLPLLYPCFTLFGCSANVLHHQPGPPWGGPSLCPVVLLLRSHREDASHWAPMSSRAVRRLFTGCLTVDRVSPATFGLDATSMRTTRTPHTSPALKPPPSTTRCRHHRWFPTADCHRHRWPIWWASTSSLHPIGFPTRRSLNTQRPHHPRRWALKDSAGAAAGRHGERAPLFSPVGCQPKFWPALSWARLEAISEAAHFHSNL
jgi:hypothetical protein